MSLPSPNHGERRGTNAPDMIVLHYTGMADTAAARARLCDPAAEVSAHWLVLEDGRTEALVPEDRRAWHAGAGSWCGRSDVNSHSIGVEIANPGDRPFAAAQMDSLERLLARILARWSIPPQRVIAHSDLAPDRKTDPGPRFDWRRLARGGLAFWADDPGSGDAGPLGKTLDALGYPPVAPEDRLHAFRLRHRPWGRGPECAADRRTAAALLALVSARKTPKTPMLIYKIFRQPEWQALSAAGRTDGAPVDLQDGFIHFSTAEQVPGTLHRHFLGETGLRLVACNTDTLGDGLRWEPSRGGALFPHLYRPLDLADVLWSRPIPDGATDLPLEDRA